MGNTVRWLDIVALLALVLLFLFVLGFAPMKAVLSALLLWIAIWALTR